MFLAEAPSFGGGELVIILVVLLAILAFAGALAIGGCFWAYQAGRGSGRAAIGASVAVAAELFVVILGLTSGGGVLSLVAVGALIAQGVLFFLGRTQPGPPPDHPIA